MKTQSLFPFAIVLLLSINFDGPAHLTSQTSIDTTLMKHQLDGKINEWPASRFTVDKDSLVRYAVDNDAQNLYLVISVPLHAMQDKLVFNGMNLFLDTKGKKKAGRGIEFPIKSEFDISKDYVPQVTNKERRISREQMDTLRMSWMIHMLRIRLFGFTDEESNPQQLKSPGSAQVAYQWDESHILHIEYLIPLGLLDKESLDQKQIDIGWKINGAEYPSTRDYDARRIMVSEVVVVPAGRMPPSGIRPINPSGDQLTRTDPKKIIKENLIWSKYTIVIPIEK